MVQIFQQMSRLYMESAVAVWNGNGTTGNENIQKFFQDLPPTTHAVNTLDAQPIIDDTSKTLLIMVSGTVRIQDSNAKQFQQTFMITAVGTNWKIVSDCFRIQDALSTIDKKK